jgi:hypothetical protein
MSEERESLVGSRWHSDDGSGDFTIIEDDPADSGVVMRWDKGPQRGRWTRANLTRDFTRLPAAPSPEGSQGRVEPGVGQVWMFKDDEHTLTKQVGTYTAAGGIPRAKFKTSYGDGMDGYLLASLYDGEATFVRHASPEASRQQEGEPGIAHVHRWGTAYGRCYTCTFMSNGRLCRKPAVVGCADSKCQENDDIIARCEAHREDIAPAPKPSEVPHPFQDTSWVFADLDSPAPKPSEVKPRQPRPRVTYESLMAEERARDGVKAPEFCACGNDGPLNENGICDACYGIHDELAAEAMAQVGLLKPVDDTPPWRPSCDPLFDIPDSGEFGEALTGGGG